MIQFGGLFYLIHAQVGSLGEAFTILMIIEKMTYGTPGSFQKTSCYCSDMPVVLK
jgi:hypothetical protein